jgi:hypothetical protein
VTLERSAPTMTRLRLGWVGTIESSEYPSLLFLSYHTVTISKGSSAIDSVRWFKRLLYPEVPTSDRVAALVFDRRIDCREWMRLGLMK